MSSICRDAAAAALLSFAVCSASASVRLVDFEGLPALPCCGDHVPPNLQLRDQYLGTFGLRFTSGSSFVSVIRLGVGHAYSGVNGIGGSDTNGFTNYSKAHPIVVEFFVPGRADLDAVTDFVSVRSDRLGEGDPISMMAYDLAGDLIGEASAEDFGGRELTIGVPGIHTVRIFGSNVSGGGTAFDDLSFDLLSAVPEPAAYVTMLVGLAGVVGIRRWRRGKSTRDDPRWTSARVQRAG